MPEPRVLVVMGAQWPRALLVATLREVGYDALGAPSLQEALAYPAKEGGQPVGLIILDHTVQASDQSLLDLLALHPDALTLKLESAVHPTPSEPWPNVLRHPVSIAEIVQSAESLLPAEKPGTGAETA